MKEEHFFVKNYNKLYSVSKSGKIYSHRKNKFLKLQKQKKGYLRVFYTIKNTIEFQ